MHNTCMFRSSTIASALNKLYYVLLFNFCVPEFLPVQIFVNGYIFRWLCPNLEMKELQNTMQTSFLQCDQHIIDWLRDNGKLISVSCKKEHFNFPFTQFRSLPTFGANSSEFWKFPLAKNRTLNFKMYCFSII